MKPCRKYRRQLALYASGDLSSEEEELLRLHVQACPACAAEMEELRRLVSRFQERSGLAIDQTLLDECRAELWDRLRMQRLMEGRRQAWRPAWRSWRPAVRIAAAICLLVAGVFIGRYLLPWQPRPLAEAPLFDRSALDVRGFSYDPDSRQVEVQLGDLVLRGAPSDPRIRALLVHTLTEADNPGVRLRTVKALASPPLADEEVEAALIAALEKDPNTGVRLQAIRVLKEFPLSRPIKQALIRVLLTERNPSLRKEAIDALSSRAFDPDIAPTLSGLAKSDTSAYVRRRAGKALERRETSPASR
ncbi:MAG: HEAT repeat domain-containing protein [Calditrichaeota bacterium]|nr:HEAT repeat domain-containing protein [Calditrichota bacterium]